MLERESEYLSDDEADYLLELLKACHRVLPKLARHDDEHRIAENVRETCRAVEARLKDLGVDVSAQTS
jgi:hypothetical protein